MSDEFVVGSDLTGSGFRGIVAFDPPVKVYLYDDPTRAHDFLEYIADNPTGPALAALPARL